MQKMWSSHTPLIVLVFFTVLVRQEDGNIRHSNSSNTTFDSNESQIINGKEKFDNFKQNNTCMINLTSAKELEKVIAKLHKIISVKKIDLVFIHLNIEGCSVSNEVLKHRLTEWQFLSPDEDLMRQMPIDYLVLIFGYSDFGSEDASIRLHPKMEPPGCNLNENNIEDVKKILWSTLLFNYSSHSLCNRNFETDRFLKFLLFYVTSVWIGYDLDCQTMIQWQENEYRYLKKDFQHAIIALGSFLVAIQFLWLFKLIKQEKFTEFRYKRGDRPSGIKRAMKKFLYTPIKTYTFSPGSLGNILLNSPTFRFSAVVNWTILLFIGLYRVLYRHAIAEKLFHAHFIMYSNEPLCDLVGSSTSCTCDLIFMMVSSYLVVFIATAYYEYIPPGDKIEIFKKKCKFSKLPEYFKNKFNSGKYLQDGWKAKLRNILSKAQLQNITFILGLPIATILVVVGLIIFAAFYLLKILIEGLLIPHLFFRKCNSKSKWWIKVLIMITFPITLRPMISSLLFILRSATYIIFVLLPLHQQLLRSFVVGMSIIVYAIKYEIEMVDLNAKILLEILKDQSEPYIEEKFYTFVKKGLKRSLKNVKFFICKCFLAFIYFLITLQTIYKSKNSTGHQEFFLSVFVIGLPWIADAYFNRKTLTEKDKENIGSLVEKYKKQSGLNVP